MSRVPVTPEELNARIAKLRTVTGKAERLQRTYRCSCHGKDYNVSFERTDPSKKFKVTTIAKKCEERAGEGGSSSSAPAEKTYPASAIDFEGHKCPWCGATGSVMHSVCGILWCGGAKESEEFTCPQCRITFGLVDATEIGKIRETHRGQMGNLLAGAAGLLRLGKRNDT